jgi:ferrous iron transport protein A
MAELTLDDVPLHAPHQVSTVAAPDHAPDWAERLAEIGFLPGEIVAVTARGAFGGDPLVVRVGLSSFALRRAEAACVHVTAIEAASSVGAPA